MAEVAFTGTDCNMPWISAGGNDAVMAGSAQAKDRTMVDSGYMIKCDRIVAILTYLTAVDVCRGFTRGDTIIVAVLAYLLNLDMIISCAYPGSFSVTVIAEITAGKMFEVFTGCTDAVMAYTAIHRGAFEISGYMAVGTIDHFMSSD